MTIELTVEPTIELTMELAIELAIELHSMRGHGRYRSYRRDGRERRSDTHIQHK